jgi:aspartyl-tRNA(Asn)/glutamyl-tRNA(Gln) amidotransferase subunit C
VAEKSRLLDLVQVRHIANLAHLELSPNEQKDLFNDLNQILHYFEEIDSVATENIVPMSHSLALTNVLAEDKTHQDIPGFPQDNLNAREALANAPDQEKDQVRVPAILGD